MDTEDFFPHSLSSRISNTMAIAETLTVNDVGRWINSEHPTKEDLITPPPPLSRKPDSQCVSALFQESLGESASPTTGPPSRIEPGTYIAFSLDRDAICAHFPLDSPAYRDLQRLFPFGRFIGLVTHSRIYTSDGRAVQELEVNFVSEGPLTLPSAQNLYLSIEPTVGRSWRGEALKMGTPTPFPFRNLVQWPALGARLKVETLHDASPRIMLDADSFARFQRQTNEDIEELNRISSTWTDKEFAMFEHLQVPVWSDPAEVWTDVSCANRTDPTMFVVEQYITDGWIRVIEARHNQPYV
ncbi:hypothetical protein AcW2_007288 [Taiwanofungus camphoratus]|nr:hypothetical protein AcW2_007288 [Antrodia cinnamomea]